jgi:hypothetical protein
MIPCCWCPDWDRIIFGSLVDTVDVTFPPVILSVVVPSAVTMFPIDIADTPFSVPSRFSKMGFDVCKLVGRSCC